MSEELVGKAIDGAALIIGSYAWPAAVIGTALLFRSEISDALKGLRKAKFKDFEVEIEKLERESIELAAEAPPQLPAPGPEVSADASPPEPAVARDEIEEKRSAFWSKALRIVEDNHFWAVTLAREHVRRNAIEVAQSLTEKGDPKPMSVASAADLLEKKASVGGKLRSHLIDILVKHEEDFRLTSAIHESRELAARILEILREADDVIDGIRRGRPIILKADAERASG